MMSVAPATRPVLRLVPPPVPVPAAKKWQKPRYRPPDPERLTIFRPLVRELLDYALAAGLRVAWITFTSSAKGPKAVVAADIKKMWEKFRHKTVARQVPAFLATFSTHGRPHVHVLAVLSAGTSARAICGSWSGGFTSYSYVDDRDDADDLSAYCASQFSPRAFNHAIRRRSFSYRPPPGAHLVCSSPAIPPSYPAALPRACAGGGASSGEGRPEGHHAGPSASEEPQAAASVGGPEGGPELRAAPPHRRSERILRLVPPPPPMEPMMQPPNTPAAPPTSSPISEMPPTDTEIAMIAARSFVPRNRDQADCIMGMAARANINWKVFESAIKELYFQGQVRRRKDGRGYVYWANKTLPAPIPVVVPERMRAFMLPAFALR